MNIALGNGKKHADAAGRWRTFLDADGHVLFALTLLTISRRRILLSLLNM